MNSSLLRAYVAVATVAAMLAIASLPVDGLAQSAVVVAALALCSAVIGSRSIRLPGTGLRVTASDLFVFVALAGPAPLAAPLVAAAGTLGSEWGALRERKLRRSIFNFAVVPLSAALASWVVLAISSSFSGRAAPILAVLAGSVVYLSVNLALVAGAVALEGRRPFFATVASAGPWALVSVLASAVMGLGLHAVVAGVGPPALCLGFAVIPPTSAYLRSHARPRVEA